MKQAAAQGTTMPSAGSIDLDRHSRQLCAEAQGFVPRDRVERMMRQWLARAAAVQGEPPEDARVKRAEELAQELAASTPSMTGTTAFDRLARSVGNRSPQEAALLTALRRAQYRLLRHTESGWQDMAAGASVSVYPSAAIDPARTSLVFARFAPLSDGTLLLAGTAVALDATAASLAESFIRPDGKGLNQPLRCAEAMFRDIVVNGAHASAQAPEPRKAQRPLPFDPAGDPVDALAAGWGDSGGLTNEDQIAGVRRHANVASLVNSCTYAVIARDVGMMPLSAAYADIALVMMETIVLRASYGSGGLDVNRLSEAVAEEAARRRVPARVLALFHELRPRMSPARGAGRVEDAERDRLVQRIRALRAKTVEQGCTEEEALAAAEKAADLLDRYGLSLSELDLRRQSCEGVGIETGRKRRGPIDECMVPIARFFDCRAWSETARDGTLRYVFFGLPADVQAADYLHDLIVLAFETETRRFQAGAIYRDMPSGSRRSATNSFQIGLARGIEGKLDAILASRETARRHGSGRDLVPLKDCIIDQELARLGLAFQRKGGSGRRTILVDAFAAGKKAAERFEYRPGIERG
ncbi:MAG: DUF2786 domain-containing protein [Acetobacteraceae bacterium]